jgi:maltose O-acetyltransferase
MLAGECYNCLDPDLEAERQRTRKLLRLHNLAEAMPERRAILEQLLGQIGQNSSIEAPFYCSYGQNIHLGDHVFLNVLCTILDCNEVRVGDHVMIGPAVQIYTAAHVLEAEARNEGWEVAKPILIEDNVWIGGGAILLPGVRIGRGAVVGAGAVVSRSVPASTVVAGNPARVIREIEPQAAGRTQLEALQVRRSRLLEQDALGRTPLFYAAEQGLEEKVREMIFSFSGTGLSLARLKLIAIKDHSGLTAADVAEQNGHEEIASLLRSEQVRMEYYE